MVSIPVPKYCQISIGGLSLNGKSLFYLHFVSNYPDKKPVRKLKFKKAGHHGQIQPPLFAKNITSWLAERGVSQMVFAKLYMERS